MTSMREDLRSDGKHQSLLNPSETLIANARGVTPRTRAPYHQAATIRIMHEQPGLVAQLLAVQEQLECLDVLGKINASTDPDPLTLAQHSELVTTQLGVMEEIAMSFGSLDAFIELWNGSPITH